MGSPFVAEIRVFGFNFPPTGWAYCSGQLLPISQNTALFSLLGTFYGGDGKSTFALPNLQGNVAIGSGQSQTGSIYDLAQTGGSDTVTLLEHEMPAHSHTLNASNGVATTSAPSPAAGLARSRGGNSYDVALPTTQMAPNTAALTGGSLPHNNMMPYLTLNYCIAMQGVFPPRG
jgi:microcystin-dependent protein